MGTQAEPERKTDMVRRLVREQKFKEALRIAKDFRLGIAPAHKNMMAIAYECIVHPEFYKALHIDIGAVVEEGKQVLTELFL